MRHLLLILVISIVLFNSCKKSNSSYNNHNSPLMQAMHKMDDSMQAMVMTKDPDHDFAMMMMMHHMGAIDMANYELANGTDATIKSMAQTIKAAQMKEIATLDSFVQAHNPSTTVLVMMDSLNASMNRMVVKADAQTLKGQSDHDFAHLMIVHHTSAVEMASAEIMYGQVAFMKDMATMMKADQTMEISQFQSWLNSGKD
jgi:uncharacterized protein (DUF305 family)